MKEHKIRSLRLLNALAFTIMVAVNALAEMFSLGGVKTGDISKRYQNLFTPAEYTFAIWGAIYLLLAGFVVYQSGRIRNTDRQSRELVERVGVWFAASCTLNIAWLFEWHYDMIALSTVIIIGLLAALVVLNEKTAKQSTRFGWLLGRAPFSLYYGWITIAVIANISVLLTKLGWDGWGIAPQLWMVIVLSLGTFIAGIVIIRNADFVYGIAVIWAYAGILVRHISQSGFDVAYPAVITTAALCEAVLAAVSIYAAFAAKKSDE